MRIGIDISQIVHEGTGVGSYVRNLVATLVRTDPDNDYVLLGASLRRKYEFVRFMRSLAGAPGHVRLVVLPIPPVILDFLWNTLHIIPVEWFTGGLDVFWSSDWTQPPLAHARGVTTIHDLIAWKYPEETHHTTAISAGSGQLKANIVKTHKRRMHWAQKECRIFFCDSIATQKDAEQLLGIPHSRTKVVYPGNSL